jgi:DNA-binding response OmpR family regulator
MLPGIEGGEVCRKLRARKNATPILMLTALDASDEKVEGLRIGADDYLTKPFDFDELVARIEALRRRAALYGTEAGSDAISVGTITYDRHAMKVMVRDEEIRLSKKERDLLVLFLTNPGRVLSRERILNAVWGMNEDPLTNIVDVYIGRIRRKLGAESGRIATLRDVGYRMD